MLTIGQKVFWGKFRQPGTVTAIHESGSPVVILLDDGRTIITAANQVHTTQEE